MSKPAKFERKIPTIVHAMQFNGPEDYYPALEFMGRSKQDRTDAEGTVYVNTLEGPREAQPTDWIVKDVWGNYWKVADGSFKYQYKAVGE